MSPLLKYYGAAMLALAIPAAWFFSIGHIAIGQIATPSDVLSMPSFVGVIVASIGLQAYFIFFIRCPRCNERLQGRRTFWSWGLPRRRCRSCGYDLLKNSS
jgi:hypothetical protein